jgi:hypothetical protein
MSDEELRALERSVHEGGGPQARIRHADALERVGRIDEALDVLLAGREDADVRARIGRLPLTSFASFEGPPRVVWTKEWPGDETERIDGRSYDSTDIAYTRRYHGPRTWPLAIAVDMHEKKVVESFSYDGGGFGGESTREEESDRTHILDPETGELRGSFFYSGFRPIAVLGDVVFPLFPGSIALEIHDLAALNPRTEFQKKNRITQHEGLRVHAVVSAGAIWARDAAIFLERRPERRGEPSPLVPVAGFEAAKLEGVFAGGTLAVARSMAASGETRFHAIDLERAVSLYETALDASSVLVDAAGWLAAGAAVSCFDRRGLRWKKDLPGASLRVLGRSAALVEVVGAILLIDRESGRERQLEDVKVATLAADRVYSARGTEVLAHDLEGRPLWRFALPDAKAPIVELAPAPRRLVAIAGCVGYCVGGGASTTK